MQALAENPSPLRGRKRKQAATTKPFRPPQICEVQILDHAIAENVDLRADWRRQIFSPRNVPIQRV
jgi:hypothetical protein